MFSLSILLIVRRFFLKSYQNFPASTRKIVIFFNSIIGKIKKISLYNY